MDTNVAHVTTSITKGKNEITCPNCGASDVEIVSNDYGTCRYCDSQVKLKHNVVNNYFISNNSKEDVNYYVVDKAFSQEDFFRAALITLSLKSSTPLDILESSFDKVTTSYPQYMIINAHYQGNYSASIGYDKEVKYYDTNSHGDLVAKTKIVTDWQPFNGALSQEQRSCVKISGNDDPTSNILLSTVDYASTVVEYMQSDYQNIAFEEVTQQHYDTAVYKGKVAIDNSIHLPGDHFREFRSNYSHDIKSKNFYLVPEYNMKFKYQDASCDIKSFAYDMHATGKVPDVTTEIKSEINKATLAYAVLSLGFSVISIIMAILYAFVLKNTSYIWVPIVSIVVTIVFYVIYYQVRKKKTEQINKNRLIVKRQRLIKYLADHNLAPLTADEKAKFGKETT